MTARAHVLFFGRVQGVFFRDHTRRRAAELGVLGWVRNLSDGSVEAVMEGPRDRLESLIEWCRTGPPQAHVTQVNASWEEPSGEFRDFTIRR